MDAPSHCRFKIPILHGYKTGEHTQRLRFSIVSNIIYLIKPKNTMPSRLQTPKQRVIVRLEEDSVVQFGNLVVTATKTTELDYLLWFFHMLDNIIFYNDALGKQMQSYSFQLKRLFDTNLRNDSGPIKGYTISVNFFWLLL